MFKKLIFTVLFCFTFATASAQFLLGGGLGYHGNVAGAGVLAKAEFEIMEDIAISPSVSYFFGDKIYGFNTSLFGVDVNGHYYFHFVENLVAYPLAGVNFSSFKVPFSTILGSGSVSENVLGLNIGAGGRYQFTDNLAAFAELRFIVNGVYRDFAPTAGVLIQL
ncbi:MAG: porin family protein [Flavobacteriaceae bacterium]|nr:porin family protein [Flavobacteriaceae bacterium]